MNGAQVLDRETSRHLAPTSVPTKRPRGIFVVTPSAARRIGAVLTLLGLASMAVVAIAVAAPRLVGGAAPPSPQPPFQLTTVVDASTVRTSGPAELSLRSVTYLPGESSGWHVHPGMHLVSILSGTLTVYEADCRAQTFGPGQPYLGGEQLHLARNEANGPLEMAVTYVARPAQVMEHFRIDAAAPANCLAS